MEGQEEMKRNIISAILALLIAPLCVVADMIDTEYASNSVAYAAVNFPPDVYGQTIVKSIYETDDGTSTTILSKLMFYAKGGGGRLTPLATNANTSTTIFRISNTSAYLYTNSDLIVYYHPLGDTVDYRTVSSATTTSVTLDSAISPSQVSGDTMYEITLQGEIDLRNAGETNSAGFASVNKIIGDYVFATPTDSPLRVTADLTGGANSNVTLQVTVDR